MLFSPFTNESPKNETGQGAFLKSFREKWLSWVFPAQSIPVFSPVNKQPFSTGLKRQHSVVDCLPGTCEIPSLIPTTTRNACLYLTGRKMYRENVKGGLWGILASTPKRVLVLTWRFHRWYSSENWPHCTLKGMQACH